MLSTSKVALAVGHEAIFMPLRSVPLMMRASTMTPR
jgi:hypothetical protein